MSKVKILSYFVSGVMINNINLISNINYENIIVLKLCLKPLHAQLSIFSLKPYNMQNCVAR